MFQSYIQSLVFVEWMLCWAKVSWRVAAVSAPSGARRPGAGSQWRTGGEVSELRDFNTNPLQHGSGTQVSQEPWSQQLLDPPHASLGPLPIASSNIHQIPRASVTPKTPWSLCLPHPNAAHRVSLGTVTHPNILIALTPNYTRHSWVLDYSEGHEPLSNGRDFQHTCSHVYACKLAFCLFF